MPSVSRAKLESGSSTYCLLWFRAAIDIRHTAIWSNLPIGDRCLLHRLSVSQLRILRTTSFGVLRHRQEPVHWGGKRCQEPFFGRPRFRVVLSNPNSPT